MPKPKCKLVGTDGNIFALIGKAAQTLKQEGQKEEALEMTAKCFKADRLESSRNGRTYSANYDWNNHDLDNDPDWR